MKYILKFPFVANENINSDLIPENYRKIKSPHCHPSLSHTQIHGTLSSIFYIMHKRHPERPFI